MIGISPNVNCHVRTFVHYVTMVSDGDGDDADADDLVASSPDTADATEIDRIFAGKCFRWSLIIQH